MTAGLIRAAELAARWAATAENQAGKRAESVHKRLKNLLTNEDFGAIASYFGANALRAIQSTLLTEADAESTDPESLTLRECAVCGATTPVEWSPPRG